MLLRSENRNIVLANDAILTSLVWVIDMLVGL
jgi:hypothetical protein